MSHNSNNTFLLDKVKPHRMQEYLTKQLDKRLLRYSNFFDTSAGKKAIYAELTEWLDDLQTHKAFSSYKINLSYRDKTFQADIEYFRNDPDAAPNTARTIIVTYPSATASKSTHNHVLNHYAAFDYAMKGI